MVRTPASAPLRTHFVVDGSNIATEGRSAPSLQQLNEAVLAFMEEHPDALVTVVVDATFGHRIDKHEVAEFDDAVANNELVTPPAGAVGRGDAFVLSIAHKAKAGILSNDSFQEFHGKYEWLFDQGRLIGGKPVPHVGWVFVERSPVRGPKSRQSVKQAKQSDSGAAPAPRERRSRRTTTSGSPLANEPLPVPSTPPPGPARAVPAATAAPEPADTAPAAAPAAPATPAQAPGRGPVNEWGVYFDFVERHPVGTSCTAVVESYSSHGAYARADAVLVYIPLRLMDSPPPRSARSRLKLGEAVTLVVVGYAPERGSVDAALPHMAPSVAPEPAAAPAPAAPKRPRRSKGAAAVEPDAPTVTEPAVDTEAPTPEAEPAPATPKKQARSRRSTPKPAPDAPVEHVEQVEQVDAPAPAKRPGRSRAAKAADTPVAVEPPAAARPTRQRKSPAPAAATTEPVAAKKPARAAKKAPAKAAAAEPATAPAKPRAPRKKAAG